MVKDLNSLNPAFKAKVLLWLKDVEAAGIKIIVTETFRSTEDQQADFKKGTSKLDGITHLSEHQKGRAIDIAFDTKTYGSLYPEDLSLWRKVAAIGRKYGIIWPYDDLGWHWDKPHFQDNYVPLTNPHMTDEQTQALKAAEYAIKTVYNFGTDKMKAFAEKAAEDLRTLYN